MYVGGSFVLCTHQTLLLGVDRDMFVYVCTIRIKVDRNVRFYWLISRPMSIYLVLFADIDRVYVVLV